MLLSVQGEESFAVRLKDQISPGTISFTFFNTEKCLIGNLMY